jgi:four helix bundle protein
MKGTVKRFEDLDVWQVSRELVKQIYGITKNGPVIKDYSFVDQIRRAATSVMNNTAEGYERGSNKDFARFMFIARGSVGEVRSMLYVALDQGYLDQETFDACYNNCVRTSQLCWGLIRYIQKNGDWKTGFAVTIMLLAASLSPSLLTRL